MKNYVFLCVFVASFLTLPTSSFAADPAPVHTDKEGTKPDSSSEAKPSKDVDPKTGKVKSFADNYYETWQLMHGHDPKNGTAIYTGDEAVFVNNAKKFSQHPFFAESGRAVLNHLQRYTKSNGCIPKMTFAGHGWRYVDGGPGLPMARNNAGLYTNEKAIDRLTVKGKKSGRIAGARSLDDLKDLVDKKKIKFCDNCMIQIHSCNIELDFGGFLAKNSGCQVIQSAGRCAPVDTQDGSLDHHWISGKDKSGNYSGFVRLTPDKKTGKIFWDHTGDTYIAQ